MSMIQNTRDCLSQERSFHHWKSSNLVILKMLIEFQIQIQVDDSSTSNRLFSRINSHEALCQRRIKRVSYQVPTFIVTKPLFLLAIITIEISVVTKMMWRVSRAFLLLHVATCFVSSYTVNRKLSRE